MDREMEQHWQAVEALKHQATLQLLFRVSRLINERAIKEVAKKSPGSVFRPAHTSLFPHIPREGIRLVDLAAKIGISKQAVFQLVGDLESEGILTRKQDPRDGRCKLICFSEGGVKAIAQGLGLLVDLERRLTEQVGQRTMKRLREAILTLHEFLQDSDRTL